MKFRIPDIKSGFVFDSLRCLKANKARGVDKLGARFLKIASHKIAPSLTKLMDFSIRSSVFPKRWKIAKVAPLFKSGDREDLNNYRPISVLPILSKTLERHVHIHLYEYLLHNNLLYNNIPLHRNRYRPRLSYPVLRPLSVIIATCQQRPRMTLGVESPLPYKQLL